MIFSEKKRKARKVGNLLGYADKWDMVLMVVGSLGALTAGSCLPFAAYVFGHILDAMTTWPDAHSQLHHMSQTAATSFYVGIIAAGGYFLQVFCWMATGERQAERIRCRYLQALLRQDMAFFDQEVCIGAIVEGMAADSFSIKQGAGEKVGRLVHIAGSVISGYVVAFTQGWKLTLFSFAVFPLLIVSGYAMNRSILKASQKAHEAHANAGKIVEQVLTAIGTVIPFSGERRAVMSYKLALRKASMASYRESLASGLGMGAILFFMFNVYAVMLWLGAQLVKQGSYTGGNVMTTVFSIIIGTGALGQSSHSLAAIAAGSTAAQKMSKVINRVPMVDVTDDTGEKLNSLQGDIFFKNVKFAYPSRPGCEVLQDFTLAIPACTMAALVGESGSGKSTVACLLERFYDPLSGEILVDDIDLKNLNVGWLRQHIGLVSQDPILFTASIRDNIAYGREEVTEEELQEAVNLANASTFITSLPQGLDTLVGQGGFQLSGGQKQRIAVARAVVKNPRILILDEATSSLDAESERLVHQALEQIQVNRTTLVIAHRLTTVSQAHTIAVLHEGRIIEQGSHAELMSKPEGAFFQLVNAQIRAQNGREECRQSTSIDEDCLYATSEVSMHLPSSTYHRSQEAKENFSNRSMSFGSIASVASIPGDDPDLNWTAGSIQSPVCRSHFAQIAAYNKPEIPVILLGSLTAGINGAVMPVVGLLFAKIIPSFNQPLNEGHNGNLLWIHLFVAVACASILLVPLQNVCFCVAGEKLVRRIRLLTCHKVLHQKMAWFDVSENNSGIISSRLLCDASHMRCFVGDPMALIAQNLSTVVVGLFIAVSTCWQLALLFISLLPFYGLDGVMQVKLGEVFDSQAKVMYDEASQIAHEALSSIRTVVSYCAEKKVLGFYQTKGIICLKAGIRRALIGGVGLGVSYFLIYGSLGLSFWVGGLLVFSGKVTFDGFIKTFLTIELSAFAVSVSLALAPDIARVKPAVHSILFMLNLKCEDLTCGTRLKRLKGEVIFQNVYFSYPSRPDAQIFQDLSFTLEAGKTLAIVGESGGGKSTVLSLLQRLYDAQEGCVLIDKVNIKSLQLKWLRSKMGLVNQEPFLFNDTIRVNIKYGIEDGSECSEEEVQKAAQIANADKFIASLPLGYESIVGERGVQLSGGQKQRIAIARAIVRDPRILLLDEATSALDTEAEALVQQALEKAAMGRSTLVVAHRLATVRNANKIVVLKDGRVAEEGSHEELLMQKDGIYAALVKISSRAETRGPVIGKLQHTD